MLAPLLNLVLGVVIFASIFVWDRTAVITLLVGLLLGPLISLFSVMALVDRGARYGATICGVTLMVVGLGMHHLLGSPAREFDVAMGLLTTLVSLVPHRSLTTDAVSARFG
jgi:hypothetical protein